MRDGLRVIHMQYGRFRMIGQLPHDKTRGTLVTGEYSSKIAAALAAALLSAVLAASAQAQDLWINEFHYDNSGNDVGEFVEVVIADSVNTPPADIEVVLYNGNGGASYGSDSLDTFASTTVPGYTIYTLVYSSNGLQNGPDGLALVEDGTLVQFLSYEGSFAADNGPAAGVTSEDVGVFEPSVPIGQSLQLSGTGSNYADFAWQAPAAETPGAVNNGQTLTLPPPVLNEIGISDTGTDAEFFEVVGPATTDLLGLNLLVVSGIEDPDFGDGIDEGEVIAQINLSGTIPGDGFWTAMSPEAETTYGVAGDQGFPDNTLANISATYLLVSGFTGAIGDDLDTDDDGTLDTTPWTAELDSIAVIDDDLPLVYSATVVGPDGAFLPPGAERCPDGSGDWFQLEFNPENGTPGTANGCTGPLPPEVVSVAPADGATGAPVTSTIIVNFNQAIDATVDAFTLDCGSGPVAFTGLPLVGGAQFVINPDADLPTSTTCNATVVAAEVTGSTGGLPMNADFVWSFDTALGALEIFEIQGAGAASPVATQTVTTESNVVTAVGANGFFMQTPDARSDNDIDTSDGIFVFTGGAPGVAVGDLVDVTGEVVEFFDFTEFTNSPTVTVTGTAALPTPVTFDANVPSTDPLAPSCAIEFECYEGMRVSLPEGIVGSGNQFFVSEPLAEVSVKAGSARNLREPGIAFPGQAGLPVWDGNPEVFEISPAALGLPELALFGGTRVQAEGVLAFSFGDYELWPSSLTILDSPTLPGTAPAAAPGNVAIGSINVFRLFDDVDDPGSQDDGQVADPVVYASRLSRFAGHIVDAMGAPAVIAFQEVESENVLLDLAAEIATIDAGLVYSAELIEGNDVGGIDVGYLVRDDATVLNVDQLGESETLSFDGSLLHDRPPLLLQIRFTDGADSLDVNLLAVHNRSLGGIEGGDATRVRTKRLEQAQSIGQMVQNLQTAQPDTPLVVLGDFNAFEFTDGYVDVIGQIAGTAVAADNDFWAPPIPSPGLEVATLSLPAQERYSFVFQGNAQALDHALYNADAAPNFVSMTYTRGQADAPEAYNETPPAGEEGLGISDHDSFVIQLAIVAEVLFADGFESN